jgi:hypothetical protein
MSPSSRGLVPGLFLALAAALGVLGANAHWLFPAQGETGVRYFISAPALARGHTPLTPWIPAGETAPQDALAGRGRLMPTLMAGLIRQGAKPHVSALWVLAGSAAVAVVGLSWAAGGVAGIWGALAAGLGLLAAPLTLEAVTVLGPDALLAALAALLMGALTYRPRASALHGAVGAAAWLAHPAGLGLAAASMVWPFSRGAGMRSHPRRLGAAGAAALPAILLLAFGAGQPLLVLPGVRGGDLAAGGATLSGVLSFAGAGLPGTLGDVFGGLLMVLLAGLVILEARATPPPPADVHWSDPAAPDALALAFRPAAGLVALGAALGSWAAWTGEALSAPWFAAAIPLAALAGAAAVRWKRRHAGVGGWLPAACLALWILGSALGSWRDLTRLRETGRGYTSAHWVASSLIRWIDNESVPFPVLYADQPALILLQTGRPSREIQLRAGGLDAFVSAFGAAPGAVVLTGGGRLRADEVAERLGLRTLVDDPHGRALAR